MENTIDGIYRTIVREELAVFKRQIIEYFEGKKSNNTFTKRAMNTDEAIEFIGCSKNQLYQLTSKKLIPHSKRGGSLAFDRDKLEEWRLENEVPTVYETRKEAMKLFPKRRRAS